MFQSSGLRRVLHYTIGLCFFIFTPFAVADNVQFYQEQMIRTDQLISNASRMLELLKSDTQTLQQQHESMLATLSAEDLQTLLGQVQLEVTHAELELASARIAVQRVDDQIKNLKQKVDELTQRQVAELVKKDEIASNLQTMQSLLQKDEDYRRLLKMQLEWMEKRYNHQLAWQQTLQDALRTDLVSIETKRRQQAIAALERQYDVWNGVLTDLRQKRMNGLSVPQIDVLQAEEKSQIIFQQITTLELQFRFQELAFNLEDSKDSIKTIARVAEQIDALHQSIDHHVAMVSNKLNLLASYQQTLLDNVQKGMVSKNALKSQQKVLTDLREGYQGVVDTLNILSTDLDGFKGALTAEHNGLLYRQTLPQTLQQWHTLVQSLVHLPTFTRELLMTQWQQMNDALLDASTWQWFLLIIIELAWCSVCYFLWRILNNMLQTELAEDARFATKTFRFIADSLARNIVAMSILAMVGGCIILAIIIGRSLSTFISLGMVWFIFKLMITIARIILVENTEHIEGKDVQLFEIIRGTFVVGGLMTAIIVVIHQLILPVNVAGFVDRLYMIVLLILSYPLLRHSGVVAELFLPYVNDRIYLCKTIRLLVFLFPLMIFSNALIGLIGFVNLAWQIAVIEGRITLIICCWLIMRGLLGDLMQAFSEWCIRHVANGWLWTQAVLRPLHNILLVALGLLGGVMCLFAFDMDFNAPIVQKAGNMLFNPLIKVGQTDITIMSIFLFITGFAIVSWAAKWSREFSYRWFYRSVKDSGVRDSLAVFTQYGVVVIGFFAILHVLGIDLTTLTVVAAAFSIGIAFGVRDIVNNVISGLLLLIERPVRKGDWIQVSNYEGEVTQIGLRAITIQTGQNTEVIVPNTDTMIKPFTNWTRQDSIIRSQFEIKIPLHDNPTWVRQLISDAVGVVEGVVSQPAVDVLLTDVTDRGFVVEVRYYVDLRSSTARSRIKSEVITSVWQALKKAGIRLPLPEHLVHICE